MENVKQLILSPSERSKRRDWLLSIQAKIFEQHRAKTGQTKTSESEAPLLRKLIRISKLLIDLKTH